jgi:hypothetical protein
MGEYDQKRKRGSKKGKYTKILIIFSGNEKHWQESIKNGAPCD